VISGILLMITLIIDSKQQQQEALDGKQE
jgi:hypothetical protein